MSEMSESIGELANSLAKAQAAMGTLVASHEVKNKDGTRRYLYADLADALDASLAKLNAEGIAVLQMPATPERNGITVSTMLAHSSGQWILSDPLFMPVSGGAQDVGSAITYGRRYQLLAMVGLAPEDDDGEKAQGAKPESWDKPQETCSEQEADECEKLCYELAAARSTDDKIVHRHQVFAAAWSAVALRPDPEANPGNMTTAEAGLVLAWLRQTAKKLEQRRAENDQRQRDLEQGAT